MDTINHYENHLADHYTWLFGGLDSKTLENKSFFLTHGIHPKLSKVALDLGCGSGFQSIPLAQLGFEVIGIDLSVKLINELNDAKEELPITLIHDNLLNVTQHGPSTVELVVCMGDTLTHLNSLEEVTQLFERIYEKLESHGKFILTFRDLTYELKDLDRFLPVNQDEFKLFTCFLEYETETVKVYDLIYEKIGDHWHLKKSFYRKLRLSADAIVALLEKVGFSIAQQSVKNGLVTIIAEKK